MKENRANKEQVKARVGEIAQILLDGATSLDIDAYIDEKQLDPQSVWHVPEGQTGLGYSQRRRYIQRAEAAIANTVEKNRNKLFKMMIAQRNALFASSKAKGDERTALACSESIEKLLARFGRFPALEERRQSRTAMPIILNVNEQVIVKHELSGPAAVPITAVDAPRALEIIHHESHAPAQDDQASRRPA